MSVDGQRERLERGLDVCERSLDRLEEAAPGIVRELLNQHSAVKALPAASRDRANALQLRSLTESIEFGRRMLAIERRLLQLPGDPAELRRIAASLDDEVRAPAVELAEEVRSLAERGTAEWSDETAAAYRLAASDHDVALESAASSSALIAETLTGVADDLDAFSDQLEQSVGSAQHAVMRFVLGVLGMASGAAAVGESDRFVTHLAHLMRATDEQLRAFQAAREADEQRVRSATEGYPRDWDEGRRG